MGHDASRLGRRGHQDIGAIVSYYADDAIFITPDGVLRGKDGVRQACEKLASDVPGAQWELPTQIYEDDIPAARVEGDVIDPRRSRTGSTRSSFATV